METITITGPAAKLLGSILAQHLENQGIDVAYFTDAVSTKLATYTKTATSEGALVLIMAMKP